MLKLILTCFLLFSSPLLSNTNLHSVTVTEQQQTFQLDTFQTATLQGSMPSSQSCLPPASPQAPINVHTASLPVDPAGAAGTITLPVQQTQPIATPMQSTDITPAVPQQTQPVMIPQQTIVQQQQQTGLDLNASTLQQLQQQIVPQATVLTQQKVGANLPPTENQQLQKNLQEPPQQVFVQQPVPPVLHQQVLPTQTGMDQLSLPQPEDQQQNYRQLPVVDQTTVQPQQLQQQQTLLLQQHQQSLPYEEHQLYAQQHLDQQLHLLQQQQQQQTLLQHQHQPPPQLKEQSQLYQQIVQAAAQKEPERQQPCGQQQQNTKLQQQPHQEQQLQQQQALLRQLELQQQQQQALMQQQLQMNAVLQQQQLQQQAQLQQQQQEQQAKMKQQQEQQQQALLQQQQAAAIIQLQQSQRQDTGHFPPSNSEHQMQHLAADLQQVCVSQMSLGQFTPHTPLTQQVMEQQQQALLIQQQKAFITQPQHRTSVMEPHIPPGAAVGSEVIQQRASVSQAPAPVTAQPLDRVRFGLQSTDQVAQTVTEACAMIQGQSKTNQIQQMNLHSCYQGHVLPTQSQGAVLAAIQTSSLQKTTTQPHQPHGQSLLVDMMGRQSQPAAQPAAASASIPCCQVQHQPPSQQNAQMTGLMQPQLRQETQDLVHAQGATGPLTPHYGTQLTHQAVPVVQQDINHVAQQLQQAVLTHKQVILSPRSVGAATTTDGLDSAVDPANFAATLHHVQPAGQAHIPNQAVRTQQNPLGCTSDPSLLQPLSQAALTQTTEQYQQQLHNVPPVHQLPAASAAQAQILTQPSAAPFQPPAPMQQVFIPLDETQHLHLTKPHAQTFSNILAENSPVPLHGHLAAAIAQSPHHQYNQMLPPHTHPNMGHAQAQTFTQTQSVLPCSVFPAQQTPLSPSHTSSLPSIHPAAAPAPELPTSPPAAQVTKPRPADFIPTSPPPVATPQMLDSNAPQPPQASLQDCDLSLLGNAQVQEE